MKSAEENSNPARVRAPRASDDIVRSIRRALFSSEYESGQRVGSEVEMADVYGVSRTTMRDALQALQATGVVETRTGVKGGVWIAKGDPMRFADTLGLQLTLIEVEPIDAMAAQAGLEWSAAEQAATIASADEVETFGLLVERLRAEQTAYRGAELYERCQETLVSMSHNWAVSANLRALQHVIGRTRTAVVEARIEEAKDVARTVFLCIQRHDGARAGHLVRQWLAELRSDVLKGEHPPSVGGLTAPFDGGAEEFPLHRFQTLKASEEIVRQVSTGILRRTLRAGQQLGSIADLERRFGVSRTTVRDALFALEANHLVEVRKGPFVGVRIAKGDPHGCADALAVQLKLIGLNASDAIWAELGLEWAAAELACEVASESDLDRLGKLVEDSAGLVDVSSDFDGCAMAFHDELARASGNWAIVSTLWAIREIMGRKTRHTPPNRARMVVETHRAIYQAMRKHDKDGTMALLRRHVSVRRSTAHLAEAEVCCA